MLDTTNLKNTPMTVESMDAVESDTVEAFELAELPTNDSLLFKLPIARYFAFLVGGGLATLGVLSLLASLTGHDTLVNLFQVNTPMGLIYLITGVAGLGIARLRNESAAVAYTIAIMFVYITVFSVNNIAYGNAEGMPGGSTLTILSMVHIHDLPVFMENGMQVTLALVALLVAMAVGLQQGARATARRGQRLIREYRSHTTIRSAAQATR